MIILLNWFHNHKLTQFQSLFSLLFLLYFHINLLFVGEDEAVSQAQRLAYVLFGSQLDVVIEAQDWFRLRKLVPNFYYVYAGLDNLYRVYFKYPYKIY